MAVRRLVSGGQTGADRAALDAALASGLDCGGFCPAGRGAEDGAIPPRYPLTETGSADPAQRTRANVAAADGTLLIVPAAARDAWGAGTRLTEAVARETGKPCLVLVPGDGEVERLVDWIEGQRIAVLNVAGPRESEAPGIYAAARDVLERMISAAPRPPA